MLRESAILPQHIGTLEEKFGIKPIDPSAAAGAAAAAAGAYDLTAKEGGYSTSQRFAVGCFCSGLLTSDQLVEIDKSLGNVVSSEQKHASSGVSLNDLDGVFFTVRPVVEARIGKKIKVSLGDALNRVKGIERGLEALTEEEVKNLAEKDVTAFIDAADLTTLGEPGKAYLLKEYQKKFRDSKNNDKSNGEKRVIAIDALARALAMVASMGLSTTVERGKNGEISPIDAKPNEKAADAVLVKTLRALADNGSFVAGFTARGAFMIDGAIKQLYAAIYPGTKLDDLQVTQKDLGCPEGKSGPEYTIYQTTCCTPDGKAIHIISGGRNGKDVVAKHVFKEITELSDEVQKAKSEERSEKLVFIDDKDTYTREVAGVDLDGVAVFSAWSGDKTKETEKQRADQIEKIMDEAFGGILPSRENILGYLKEMQKVDPYYPDIMLAVIDRLEGKYSQFTSWLRENLKKGLSPMEVELIDKHLNTASNDELANGSFKPLETHAPRVGCKSSCQVTLFPQKPPQPVGGVVTFSDEFKRLEEEQKTTTERIIKLKKT